ncbi:hypothetical protein QYM36_002877 [Artemia franciscana]|uniref:Alanine--glyoxylate aminotransferase 2, mitochondrial n=1 Tax=Artemia franciscana TaxID=6661 RepID=A0AA88I6Y3_ARTSF|nr:hypothetical protein QYM36_002877 [Artemia franciscana]
MSSFVLRRAMSTIKMPSLDFKPLVYQGPTYEDVLNVRKRNLTPSLVTFYKQPVLIHQGYMQWLFDQNNKRYLDLFGGIVTVSVGHCHPGSEANDLAMLMARLYTGANDIISLRNAYHGMSPWTMQLTAHSTWKYNVATGGVHQAKNPDPYRGEWGGKRCRDSPVQTTRSCECAEGQCLASEKYVEELEEVLRYSVPKGKVAGFFAESIQGVGGTVQFPKGYLKKAFELIRNYGGICISDEVQTGFGRTGEHYWGFQMHGVTPDIVTMAKGIGNGYPMAAVITTPKIAAVLSQAIHFNTFGGNPVASAIGSAVLDAIDEDNCQANSHNVGTYFLKKLEGLRNEFPNLIGDVRGKGLMIGMELVSDRNSRTPLGAQEFVNIWETCKDMGVLLGKGGFFGNVFRIKPPMCITKEDVDFATDVIRTAIKQNKDRNTP